MATVEADSMKLPRLRPGLCPRPMGRAGHYVVKDSRSGKYFRVGEQECFLLQQLDGRQEKAAIQTAFEQRFGEPLSNDDLAELIELGLSTKLLTHDAARPGEDEVETPSRVRPKRSGQSPLNFRIPFLDPDRILTWLEPKVWFVFTPAFVVLSGLLISTAILVGLTNRHEWISMFPNQITWQTVVLLWVLICVATTLHELAHGLVCKHFGGEVREIGFLMLYFMPCLYCNVSDAWLFRERWKRMLVGAAGTYWDLCTWAAAILVWRVTLQDTTLNYVAWMLSTLTLTRVLLNLNPLIRLDGYYLLGDWLELPNLADKGRDRFQKVVRWLAWGAKRPKPKPSGSFLFWYGAASWLFLVTIAVGLFIGLFAFQFSGWGVFRVLVSGVMFWFLFKNLFLGLTGGEVWKMVKHRRVRLAAWVGALILIPALVGFIPVKDRSAGTFQVRPATRVEICAAESGFLRDISVAEGKSVAAGTPLAQIHIPDLAVNITKKQAEVRESQAQLRKLKAGSRPEELVEQRKRVTRAVEWRDLAKGDLEKSRRSHKEEMRRLDRQVELHTVSVTRNREALAHAERLYKERALSGEQFAEEKARAKIADLELEQSQSQRAAREALGVFVAEAELARREKELADHEATLKLLEAGSRPEDIEAEEARLARLSEELEFLKAMQSRVVLRSPVAGLITTPRMHEKNGQFVEKGKLICVVENLEDLVAEILVKEEDELHVCEGQSVELRPRAMPFQSFSSVVERKAPSAVLEEGGLQGTVTVYCRLDASESEVLSGMTGQARIHRGYKPLGHVLYNRALRLLRTEFWL